MIRPPRPAETPTLQALQALLPESAPTLLSAAVANPTSSSVGDTVVLRVSVANETPVGYVLAVTGSETHLAELVVAPSHRREGRGRLLVETIIESFPTPVTVHVAVDNQPARALYDAVGFREVGCTASQFDDCEGLTLQYGSR